MNEEAVLVEAILNEPDDHVHRLVYADWLLERDDPRERLVRAQGLLGPSVRVRGLKLVPVPAGTFLMGSPEAEAGRDPDEPRHEVRITRPFYLGATPVTVAQLRAFFKESGHESLDDGTFADGPIHSSAPGRPQQDDEPAICHAWADAEAFCRWLSRTDGRSFRLPTEAEWEYACRAGTTTPFSCGTELTAGDANYDTRYPYQQAWKGDVPRGQTTPVGSYPPNAFGLYDMHGNVWEWCADWYDMDHYHSSRRRDPQGPRDGTEGRVLRGGAWCTAARDCRSALRRCGNPWYSRYRDGAIGFRVALTMPPPPKPPKRRARKM